MRKGSLVALCLAALAAQPEIALCQPPGSNPGLPPSATATGLAPQKITDMAGAQAGTSCSVCVAGARLPGVLASFASHASRGKLTCPAGRPRLPAERQHLLARSQPACLRAQFPLPFLPALPRSARLAEAVQLQRHGPVRPEGGQRSVCWHASHLRIVLRLGCVRRRCLPTSPHAPTPTALPPTSLSFLVNTECIEATFDSFAAFGTGERRLLLSSCQAPMNNLLRTALVCSTHPSGRYGPRPVWWRSCPHRRAQGRTEPRDPGGVRGGDRLAHCLEWCLQLGLHAASPICCSCPTCNLPCSAPGLG